METPTYIALSRQRALFRQLELVANNVANATTSGYKADRMMFAEVVTRPERGQRMSQVRDLAVYRDPVEGAFVRTGNAFDLAIKGRGGYFAVNTPAGERYTRDGGFTLDDTGRLVTAQGYEVQGEGGPIAVQPGESDVIVGPDGTISSRDGGVVGKVRVVRFADERLLRKVANGLYASDLPPVNAPPGEVKVLQGTIESSNVRPVTEIARLINLQRYFEATQKLVEQEHRRQRDAINQIFRPHG
jgi:flagellar basal-body rod protein FlgF